MVLAIVAGAAFRLVPFALDPSLTIDDAMLSYNIASRSFLGLAHPLAFDQTAPLGFLWVLRAATAIGGLNEFALRLVPVLAGAALPYLVWLVARKLLNPVGALAAALFTALSPILILYSISAKPYETDAVIAAGLALLTLRVLEAPSGRRWAGVIIAGSLALLFSTPALFVLAGCGLALAWKLKSTRGAWPFLLAAGGAWVATFGATYLTMTRAVAVSPYMQWFWDHKFLTPKVVLSDPHLAWAMAQRLPTQVFTDVGPQPVMLVLCWGALIWGIAHLWRRHGASALVLAGPVAVALLASMLRRYPLAPRLFVFAAPLVAVLLAAGVGAARERWSSPRARVGLDLSLTLWALVLAVLSVNSSRVWAAPTRPLVAQLARDRVDKEPVYVYAGAVPAWLFYSTDWNDPRDTAMAAAVVAAERSDGNAFHNAKPRGRAVADTEGSHLVFVRRGSPVVIGLSTGIAWREGQPLTELQPDSGWADREAARIDGASDSTAWLLFTQVYHGEATTLVHALAARRGHVVSTVEMSGATLDRVRFKR